ncbi:hypothetical protein OF83DRAFT_1058144 [Amylostereum chailletii]|nr:hypothetical protein OF83DRAFT_1058144 [Amylostereum chailletii]
MDILPEDLEPGGVDALSYNDDITYEEQLPAQPSLADRISNTKVYLLSDTQLARVGKRKRGDDQANEEAFGEEEESNDGSTSHRSNAILFQGTPIANLPTESIFAYATHFDSPPMGLEWVDDTTCIMVFDTNLAARNALRSLNKAVDETYDEDGFLTARSIPMAIWPPEDRINASLGKGKGLKGTIRMRWARHDDMKKKGARKESGFYKKHGLNARKEPGRKHLEDRLDDDEGLSSRAKRPRREDAIDRTRADLDDELDAFLREESPEGPASPPSKMRSANMTEGKSLLERTSIIRAHPSARTSRVTVNLPRRARRRGRDEEGSGSGPRTGYDGAGRREDGNRRPRKTQEQLDDELDSFLNDRE